MTNMTLEQLQDQHSKLCAMAHEKGIEVAEELTVDFTTTLEGKAICAVLSKALGIAEDSEEAHSEPAKPKKARAKKPVVEVTAEQESDVVVAKKTKAKKAPAKKAVAKKKVVAKTAKKAVKGATKKVSSDGKTAWVIAKLKNGGVTRAEILAHTKWKAVSVQQVAKGAGLKLKVSEDRPFKYRAA